MAVHTLKEVVKDIKGSESGDGGGGNEEEVRGRRRGARD